MLSGPSYACTTAFTTHEWAKPPFATLGHVFAAQAWGSAVSTPIPDVLDSFASGAPRWLCVRWLVKSRLGPLLFFPGGS